MTRWLLLLAGLGSCATVPPPMQPVVDGVVDCAVKATHDVALTLLDDVASALITNDWATALGGLVKRWGEAAVDCGVQEVGAQANHRAMASGDATEGVKAERARAWLASRAVTFK